MNSDNPLLCNPEDGFCEMPIQPTESAQIVSSHKPKPLTLVYFTDPICSSCWGIEPQLRKLKLEYGHVFDIEYHMGGLLPDWSYNSGGISKPSDVAHHWDEVSLYYEMPIDGDVWLEDPLHSSYPPSVAFKAAQLQNSSKAIVFLRVLREMVFLQKKNITRWEHLERAALQAGLDAVQFKADYEGAANAGFKEDLTNARTLGVRGFPTVFFANKQGDKITVYGVRPYDVFEKALLQLQPDATKHAIPMDLKELFAHYPSLTPKEVAVMQSSSVQDATQQLEQLVSFHAVSKLQTKNGALYTVVA